VGYGLRAVFFLSTAALLANLGGYVALANLIGRTVVWSTYAAVVLYGATRVVDALVVFVLQVPPLSVLGMVSDHRFLIRQRTSFVVHVAAWYFWIRSTLGRAELRDDVQTAIDAIMAWNLPLPEVEITLGDILASGVTFYAALLLSRFIRFMLEEDVYPYLGLAKGRPYAISTLIHYSLVIIGFLLAAAALGFDMNRFTLLAGAFGVGIGFGLQTIVNNFLSGIILLTERPIQVGDTITLGDVMGEIQRIGIRSSTVRTWQGAEVIVPNADLIAHQVTNWTLTDRRRRIEIPVGVAYGSDPRLVLETLVAVGQACEQVLADPAPYALFLGFGDSALNFELRAWTDDFDAYIQVRSRLCTGIFDALAAAGLEIPFPQRDLHIKTLADPVQSASPTEEPSVPARATGDASADRDSRVG
jgi:small-conductance mechanosensitive channel